MCQALTGVTKEDSVSDLNLMIWLKAGDQQSDKHSVAAGVFQVPRRGQIVWEKV